MALPVFDTNDGLKGMELVFIPTIIGVTERSHPNLIGLITLANPIMLKKVAPKCHSKSHSMSLHVLVYANTFYGKIQIFMPIC